MKGSCSSREERLRFEGGRASSDERARVEAHMADCDSCRRQIAEARRRDPMPVEVPAQLLRRVESLVPERPRERSLQSSQPMKIWAALAAILILATTAIWLGPKVGSRVGPEDQGAPMLRSANSQEDHRLLPAAGEVIALGGESLSFSWSPSTDASRYRLVILDDRGERVFEADGRETTRRVEPESLGVGDYYWILTTTFEDGTSSTSRTRPLKIVDGASSVR